MTIGTVEVLLGIGTLLMLLYYYLTKNFDFWEKRHVPGPKPVPLFGNFKSVFLDKLHSADHIKRIYDAYPNEPAIGIFFGNAPALLLKDPDVIKDVMITNFASFADRGTTIHEDIDPLSWSLLYLEPKRWTPLRKKLTPVFTSVKLKEMLYLINQCSDHFKRHIERLVAKGDPVECQDLMAKFTTDVIGVCAFGLNMNALTEENSEFLKMGRKMCRDSWYNRARHTVRSLPHWMAVLLKPVARDDKVIDFFVTTLRDTMEYRRKNNVRRHDFVDLLMDIKDNPEKVGDKGMSELFITAQAYAFFAAGFETSSSAMSHVLYELALNPVIQDKLREEVKATYALNDGKLTYESIKGMKYLDKVFKETLRKYPPVLTLTRRAVNDHSFANTKISIPSGTGIIIPVYAIHHDSNNYPDPDKFDPERFGVDVANSRNQMSLLAFGDGPRNCIGKCFAQYQSKVGLAMAIRNFKFEVCERTCKNYVKQTNSVFLAPTDGLYLKISKI